MCNHIITAKKNPKLVNWYPATCFSLTKLVLVVAIKQYLFITCVNLTVKNVKSYLKKLIATNPGQNKQKIQGMAIMKMPSK